MISGSRESTYDHQETQTEIPSHHQSSMAKDQMRVHADSSIGLLLLLCLSTCFRDCTQHYPVSSGIGQVRDRAYDWLTLWSSHHSPLLHATVLAHVCCP